MLTTESFAARGGYADTAPIKKPITWTDDAGDEHSGEVFVVRQAFGDVEQSLFDLDAQEKRGQMACLISACIRLGEDANERFTYEQAYSLNPSAAWSMVAAINEVNSPRAHAR